MTAPHLLSERGKHGLVVAVPEGTYTHVDRVWRSPWKPLIGLTLMALAAALRRANTTI